MMQLLFSFNGRIRRTNYWLGAIGAGFAVSAVFWILFFILGGAGALAAGAVNGNGNTVNSAGAAAGAGVGIVLFILFLAYFVLMMWISLALQIKRWHDRDKSGVWVFINFIPLVGGIWALIECGFMDGTMGPNKYGPSPKGVTGPAPVAT
ncbi:MAG TPA: DUF805 domain-containing protein [Caulobacteraceae bacterium]|jgi:uncharacterized membrane protein YhaH (DUF805 family)|nr:DUF805 domain-containing protein [Caulobacteraceae bacterium]